jgi:RNA polymerase sigma-70 factor, ECF subfamily
MQLAAAVRLRPMPWGVGSLPRSRTIRLMRMASESPLDSLMTRVARGDADAFSELYDQTSSMVYGLALRVVRSEAMAEEVTQEVYLQVWRQASGFDQQRGSVKSWMATMAHRRAVDVVRGSQSARDRELKVPADRPVADVAEIAILGDERDRVRAALSSLTDLQFQVIEMAYFGGLTYLEVAERLDTPLATVKTRIRDGLIRLRSALGEDDG